jgi:hypothetical protein
VICILAFSGFFILGSVTITTQPLIKVNYFS